LAVWPLAERLAAAAPPAALTRALHTWAAAPADSRQSSLLLLLLGAGADAYNPPDGSGDSSRSFLAQLIRQVPASSTAYSCPAARQLYLAYSHLLREATSVGRAMHPSELRHLLLAAVTLQLPADCHQLLRRPGAPAAIRGVPGYAAALLALAVGQDLTAVVADMLSLVGAGFDPDEPFKGLPPLVRAADIGSVAMVQQLVAGGACVEDAGRCGVLPHPPCAVCKVLPAWSLPCSVPALKVPTRLWCTQANTPLTPGACR